MRVEAKNNILYAQSLRICPSVVPLKQRSQKVITDPLTAAKEMAPLESAVSIAVPHLSLTQERVRLIQYQCRLMGRTSNG